jgi:hypothetical protein
MECDFPGRKSQTFSMERITLTPGKLFARLSAEFRRRRGHPNCRMPMVMLAHRVSPDGPNWTLEPSFAACEQCMPLVHEIERDAGQAYDLRDPTALPQWPEHASRPPPKPGYSGGQLFRR